MIRLEQIPFEGRVRYESNPDQSFDILAVTFPDEGKPVYVINGLEDTDALLMTPNNREGFEITVRKPISTV